MRPLPLLSVLLMASIVRAEAPDPLALRVMTYNIHSCKGRDRKIRPDRIGEVIRAAKADVVALQEIRVGRVDPRKVDRPDTEDPGVELPPVGERPLPPPTVLGNRVASNTVDLADDEENPFVDQPRAIARAADMNYVFYALVRTGSQDYGIALLSRYPIRLVRAENLPTRVGRSPAEKRGAIWAEIDVEGRPVQVIATHFGLNSDERSKQVDAIMGPDWTGDARFKPPFVFCGDLNSTPHQGPYKRLAARFMDAAQSATGGHAKATWPSRFPAIRIDHVFLPQDARARSASVINSELSRISSDHLPLLVEAVFP